MSVKLSKEFLEIKENQISIGIKSRPLKGEANREIIKRIADHVGVPPTLIQIKSGRKSRVKIIEILQ